MLPRPAVADGRRAGNRWRPPPGCRQCEGWFGQRPAPEAAGWDSGRSLCPGRVDKCQPGQGQDEIPRSARHGAGCCSGRCSRPGKRHRMKPGIFSPQPRIFPRTCRIWRSSRQCPGRPGRRPRSRRGQGPIPAARESRSSRHPASIRRCPHPAGSAPGPSWRTGRPSPGPGGNGAFSAGPPAGPE